MISCWRAHVEIVLYMSSWESKVKMPFLRWIISVVMAGLSCLTCYVKTGLFRMARWGCRDGGQADIVSVRLADQVVRSIILCLGLHADIVMWSVLCQKCCTGACCSRHNMFRWSIESGALRMLWWECYAKDVALNMLPGGRSATSAMVGLVTCICFLTSFVSAMLCSDLFCWEQ